MRIARVVQVCRTVRRPDLGERGFTLVEFMIAATIMAGVLGATVLLAMQIQQAYGTELDDAAAEQEARYALDWIARDLRSAGSDPYLAIPDTEEVWINPDGGADADCNPNGDEGLRNSIRIEADIDPPDGAIDGLGEDVTIAFDPAKHVITRQDWNDVPNTAQEMTEGIIKNLCFAYLDSSRTPTTNSVSVAYVRVEVTVQWEANTGTLTTSTHDTEVRLRTR